MSTELAIIKYNAGNIQSVLYALERIGAEAVVTDDPAIIRAARHVIFPGVGEASSAMQYLRARGLDELIRSLTQPVLGICLGMQLMCRHSAENDTDCLGIFDEDVLRFQSPSPSVKVPQMGWNTITDLRTPLFAGVPQGSFCYFVHSYYASMGPQTIALTDYIQPYSAALHRDNFYGVQFHPEKSAEVGEQIIRNFLGI
jgi:glutamine amidotransferase